MDDRDSAAVSVRRRLGWVGAARWALALTAVLAVAAALRAPRLQDVPHLTDETTEVLWARAIAFEGARPLTHTDSYDGPLWPYAVAAALRLYGSSARLPRQLTLLAALATVAFTFVLGAQLAPADRRLAAGTLAGLAIATAFSHSIVGSRVAWSNNTTPAWTTLCVILLLGAVRRVSGPGLALAGLVAGLALQTHPSVAVFLLGLAVWYVMAPERRAAARGPWPWLAALCAIIAYSPVLVYNARTGLATWSEIEASANTPAGRSLASWLAGTGATLAQLGRSFVGGFGLDGPSASWQPAAALYVAAAIAALVWLAADHRLPTGRRLPLVVTITACVCLPLFNTNWQGLLESRYLGFLWPLVAASIAIAVLMIDARLARRPATRPVHSRAARAALWMAVAVMLAVPARNVLAFDASAMADDYSNERLWHMLKEATAMQRQGATVLVDRDLKAVAWRAGGHPRRAIEYLLTMEDVPYDRDPLPTMNHLLTQGGSYVLFLAPEAARYLTAHHPLAALDAEARPGEEAWGMYAYRSPSAPVLDRPR